MNNQPPRGKYCTDVIEESPRRVTRWSCQSKASECSQDRIIQKTPIKLIISEYQFNSHCFDGIVSYKYPSYGMSHWLESSSVEPPYRYITSDGNYFEASDEALSSRSGLPENFNHYSHNEENSFKELAVETESAGFNKKKAPFLAVVEAHPNTSLYRYGLGVVLGARQCGRMGPWMASVVWGAISVGFDTLEREEN